jgi:mxaA protein|tara:strand:- start:190 stop:1176 length:987 start_codon:yes stop_codon:yes gene_type:complete
MHKYLFILILLSFSSSIFSYEDPKKYKDIDPSFIKIIIKDPDQKVGYTIGDKISREIIFTVKKPYELVEESLPIAGYEKRYRGQKLGVVLQNIKYNKKDEGEEVQYTINLVYQIFTNNVVAKPASVTADYYRLINPTDPENILKYRISDFTFAISPIAVFGDIKIEDDMSPLRGPFYIGTQKEKLYLKNSIIGFIIILLLIGYIWGRFTWIPGQNKIFSTIYRNNKKLSPTPENVKKLITDLHSGFNKTVNQSLFESNLEPLLKKNKSFNNIKDEIHVFFNLSRSIFFENSKVIDYKKTHVWLKLFSLHCRMSERKLIVDPKDIRRKL